MRLPLSELQLYEWSLLCNTIHLEPPNDVKRGRKRCFSSHHAPPFLFLSFLLFFPTEESKSTRHSQLVQYFQLKKCLPKVKMLTLKYIRGKMIKVLCVVLAVTLSCERKDKNAPSATLLLQKAYSTHESRDRQIREREYFCLTSCLVKVTKVYGCKNTRHIIRREKVDSIAQVTSVDFVKVLLLVFSSPRAQQNAIEDRKGSSNDETSRIVSVIASLSAWMNVECSLKWKQQGHTKMKKRRTRRRIK